MELTTLPFTYETNFRRGIVELLSSGLDFPTVGGFVQFVKSFQIETNERS